MTSSTTRDELQLVGHSTKGEPPNAKLKGETRENVRNPIPRFIDTGSGAGLTCSDLCRRVVDPRHTHPTYIPRAPHVQPTRSPAVSLAMGSGRGTGPWRPSLRPTDEGASSEASEDVSSPDLDSPVPQEADLSVKSADTSFTPRPPPGLGEQGLNTGPCVEANTHEEPVL